MILLELDAQEDDARDHTEIGDNGDTLTELDLLQFLSPEICLALHSNC